MYGDVWLGGNHAVFSVLLANAAARGYPDKTAAYDGIRWALQHRLRRLERREGRMGACAPRCRLAGQTNLFIDGEGYALSIDWRNGMVWGSTSSGPPTSPATDRTSRTTNGGLGPLDASVVNDQPSWYVDVWPDPKTLTDAADPNFVLRFTATTRDDVRSMSHCPDGSLWVGSTTHGLARIDRQSRRHARRPPERWVGRRDRRRLRPEGRLGLARPRRARLELRGRLRHQGRRPPALSERHVRDDRHGRAAGLRQSRGELDSRSTAGRPRVSSTSRSTRRSTRTANHGRGWRRVVRRRLTETGRHSDRGWRATPPPVT